MTFCKTVLVLFDRPNRLFTGLTFGTPIYQRVVTYLYCFQQRMGLANDVDIYFVVDMAVFLPMTRFLRWFHQHVARVGQRIVVQAFTDVHRHNFGHDMSDITF